ncbi:MAG: hypothetical protein GXP49_04175 [Deltaproteobacteria bacterium]|nr:hypothetical protein [Deltaproteobacteria bacterium]
MRALTKRNINLILDVMMKALSKILLLFLAIGIFSCADGKPPSILFVTMLPNTNEPAGPYNVEAIASDDRALDKVQLWWCVEELGDDTCRKDLDNGYNLDEMANQGGDIFEGRIPGQGYDVMIEYYVLAIDDSGNQVSDPPEAPVNEIYSFMVTR